MSGYTNQSIRRAARRPALMRTKSQEMNKQTRIKSTMRTRIALLSIAGLMASFAQAGPVDPSAITTFEAGQPARAAEVNANFDALITAIDDNASQLASSGQDVAIEVDCGDVREALQQAIDGSDPTKPLRINVIGTASCGPISITRDHVTIIGGTDADPTPRTIGTNAENSVPVWVEGARHVVLSRMTIDAADGGSAGAAAAVGVAVAKGALATLDFISVQNSTGEAVTVFVNSTAILSGNNTINGGSEVALNIGGNATVFAENGLTTIESTGGACVLEMDANAVLGGPAGLDISGNCAEISGNSFLGLENGSIDVATLQVVKSQMVIEVEGEGAEFNLDTVDFNLFGGSRVFLEAQELGTIIQTGNLDVGSNSSLSARGNVVLGRGIPGVV